MWGKGGPWQFSMVIGTPVALSSAAHQREVAELAGEPSNLTASKP